MAVSPRLIRRRIKSIGNTKKITKAMELVAASKMRRAVAATLASRRYAQSGWEMILELAKKTDRSKQPLLAERPVKNILVILLTSHRGLAGGFNANILKKTLAFLDRTTPTSFLTVGRKGEDAVRRLGLPIIASFDPIGDTPTFLDARPVATLVRSEFIAGTYDRVYVAYTDYLSAVTQKAEIRQILPITVSENQDTAKKSDEEDVLFEPSMDAVFEALLPRMTDVQIYQAMLESSASEHASRMMAMRNATDAASDIIDDLSFTFNQARQAAITREISEIAAGKATLEG